MHPHLLLLLQHRLPLLESEKLVAEVILEVSFMLKEIIMLVFNLNYNFRMMLGFELYYVSETSDDYVCVEYFNLSWIVGYILALLLLSTAIDDSFRIVQFFLSQISF